MPSLLLGTSQSDPESHLYLKTRKTYLVPGYICFSNDHWSLLLGKRPWIPPCKASRERGSWVSLLEARKSFHLWSCHSLPEQGKYTSSDSICQEPFLQVIFIPCSQEATQYSTDEPLSSKLASNGKLTSDKCKKRLKNNLCFYCSAEDYKLDFCSKK